DEALAKLRVNAFVGNTSNAQPALNITDTSLLTTSDYLMEYDGSLPSGYKVRRLSDNQPMMVQNNGGVLSFTDPNGRDQGFEVVVGSPAPALNDKFTLQPTRRGATDIATVLDQADQLAFAAPVRAESNLQNAGTGLVGQPDMVSAPSPINLGELNTAFGGGLNLVATVNANGTYTLTDPLPDDWSYVDSTGAALGAAPTLTSGNTNTVRLAYTGASGDTYQFDLVMSGRPAAGDSFKLDFNQSGVSDNRNALKLADLQSKQTVGVDNNVPGSGFSLTDGYGELVERVGTLTAQARMDSEATGAILKQAKDNRDSLSAVNLDEEAANLIKFEQYYNASAQIIQVARSLFDTLISTFR
ncbi:MAG: flagellar hook-associated protein FlgK, partial [Pseudomonas stutzeri]|nr:flagellar hook-associated protein FlgK [Stutzerimonas stutzeri]